MHDSKTVNIGWVVKDKNYAGTVIYESSMENY